MYQHRWINFTYFFRESLSCTIVIRTVKEEMGRSFTLLAATANRIYTIWKIVPKFIVSQVAQSKSNSCKKFYPLLLSTLNTWLGSGLMMFSITLLKTLLEVKLQILTFIHSIIEKEFWKRLSVSGKKEFDFFEHFL